MSLPAKKIATYEDVLQAPPNMIAEVMDGELYLQPRPATGHSLTAAELGTELGSPFSRGKGGPGGWILLYEPELHLRNDIVVPDWAGWKKERLPSVPKTAFLTLSPDWACEILSPGTMRRDRGIKMDLYARERVSFFWLIDPSEKTLEAYRLENTRWSRIGTWAEHERVRVEPFDAIEIELRYLWGE